MSNIVSLQEEAERIREKRLWLQIRREIAEFANSPKLQDTALGLKLAKMVEQMDIANR